jgi:hypothetical protein
VLVADFKWCVQLTTANVNLRIREPLNVLAASTAEICAYDAFDSNGNQCGRVQLTTRYSLSISITHEFLLRKDSKFGDEYCSNWSVVETDEYNKLLVTYPDGISYDVLKVISADDLSKPYYILILVVSGIMILECMLRKKDLVLAWST